MDEHLQSSVSLKGLVAVVVLLFAMVGIAPWAHAQSDNKEEAKQLAQQGAKAFVKKDYAMAVTYFQRAASLDPNPVLLYNLSLAHSRVGNVQEARDAAERAIELGDDGVPEDTRVKLRARRDGYEAALRARSMADALAPSPPAETGGQTKEQGGVGSGTSVSRQTETGDQSPIATIGWAGVGTAVAGVGLLAGAGLVTAGVRADIDSYDDARLAGEFERAERLSEDVENGQQTGQILLYSGVGLTAVGAGLIIFDLVDGGESEKQARIITAPTRGGASVTLRLRF